ncbi:MAG: peptidoglycan DD-metalloendopeptidase family protein [Eubacteriales bacterium]|nr:peptidoglycan DD-metalloendopeptidase family protein [Eubacteriales bacterium]
MNAKPSKRRRRRLHFTDEESGKATSPTKLVQIFKTSAALQAHRQVSQQEDENVGLESAHKSEEAVESGVVTGRRIIRSRACRDSHPASNLVSRWQQKQAIKRGYVAAKAGKSTTTTTSTVESVRKTAQKTATFTNQALRFVTRHQHGLLVILGILLIIVILMNLFSSCSQLALGGLNTLISTSYTAEDQDICAADLELTRLEAELEYNLLRIESTHPGYDEYRYAIDPIGHDPHELIAYLTARYNAFTYPEVKPEIHSLFSSMYALSITARTEVRYRTETRTSTYTEIDPLTGAETTVTESYTVEVPYDYTILSIGLTSRTLDAIAYPRLTVEQRDMFLVYMDTKGNKQYFGNPFDFNWSSHVSSLYGWRVHPISQQLQLHRGLDLAVPQGTPIYSIMDGEVVSVGYDSGGYGNYLVIKDEKGYRSTYAHCASIVVFEGQSVVRGDPIATAGSTGASTGSHLHLELSYQYQYLNPYFFIEGTDPYTPSDFGAISPYTDYDIPPEAMSDARFAALITEAEKYLGYPYVWGGSTPATSFDCSGFVCWVFTNSGVYALPRTTAQGIFNQCQIIAPSEAKPGDLIFFTGTYANDQPVTHVAIVVGDGMMIHAGNPIQYASSQTSYWQSHFYAFGRLP